MIGPARVGGYVEAIRHLLLLLIATQVLTQLFSQEFKQLVSLRDWKSWWVGRLGLVSLASVVAYYIIDYHLNVLAAPRDLAMRDLNWASILLVRKADTLTGAELSDFRRAFVIPYVCYLPQSIMNYIALAVPSFIVPTVVGVRDTWASQADRRNLTVELSTAAENNIKSIFCEFRDRYKNRVARYIELPVWLGAVVAFEVIVGSKTLAANATALALFAMCLVAGTGLMFIVLVLWYERAYADLRRRYHGDLPEWARTLTITNFMLELMQEGVAGTCAIVFGLSVVGYLVKLLLEGRAGG